MVEGQETLSPTVRAVARRAVFWVALVTFALIVAIIAGSAGQAIRSTAYLDPNNPGPQGAKAVVEVLRDQGVTVTVTGSLDETREAVDDAASTTLLLFDRENLLSDEQLRRALDVADTIVSIKPSSALLKAVNPSIVHAGEVDSSAEADCDLDAATKASSIEATGIGFRIRPDEEGSDEATGCFTTDEDVFSVVESQRDGDARVTFLGADGALSNEEIIVRGNAALALNLLGENEELVWYVPTVADLGDSAQPTIGELSPPWVIPVTLTLLAGFIAAAIWRGRRLGPLIVENLPVVVRASETMQGRSRLYQANSARLHALDSLRIGTVSRLAATCGLPRAATVEQIVLATAALTGRDIQSVRRVVVEAEPRSDSELVALSDALLDLERAAKSASKPL